jgi:hypothetical protein
LRAAGIDPAAVDQALAELDRRSFARASTPLTGDDLLRLVRPLIETANR